MKTIIRTKVIDHYVGEGMCYCRVDAIPNTVEVFTDSYISPTVEAYYVSQGYKILRHKTKCPWKKEENKK